MTGISELSGIEKTAALFLIMGKDSALRLAEFFTREELNLVAEAARNISELGSNGIDELIEDFVKNYQKLGLVNGSEDLSALFTEDVEPPKVNRGGTALDSSAKIDPEVVRNFLESEAPQIGALLLDRLGDELTVEVFSILDPLLRNEIIHAYLSGNKIEQALQNTLESDLMEILQETKIDEGNSLEIAKAASLINQFPADTSDQIIGFLQGNSPEIAAAIKKSLFKFSAIELLAKEDRSILFDGVQADQIVMALSTTSEANRDAILDVLSPRNRRMVESDLARAQTPEDAAEKAQKTIAAHALKLAKDGEINLPEIE